MGLKFIECASYMLTLLGSVGSMLGATKFSLAMALWEQKHSEEKFFGITGYQVWVWSWVFILIGIGIQTMLVWVTP
jgi:hypothetical protein